MMRDVQTSLMADDGVDNTKHHNNENDLEMGDVVAVTTADHHDLYDVDESSRSTLLESSMSYNSCNTDSSSKTSTTNTAPTDKQGNEHPCIDGNG